ncbi:MAG TPA: M23 family metallopeptidase [Syntrophorhabdaceae bacterium]|nr:M23 family metallopeptidase [Syntrophorhabdaceae bacterium]
MSPSNILKRLLKKAFSPVTIMLIPHNCKKPLNLKVPSAGIILGIVFFIIGTIFVFSSTVRTIEYRLMKQKFTQYSQQFSELQGTMMGIKNSENELKKLFSLKSKKDVIENLDNTTGLMQDTIDFESLKNQIAKTIETVSEMKEYLYKQKDVYRSTPLGSPVKGSITSYYGKRIHPHTGKEQFHYGIDIKTNVGDPVKATADGIVSFSGWLGDNGNLVVIEHGMGFSTYYAHNKKNLVKVGQKVKKGDTIAYVGSTGNAQTAHLHYSVLRNGNYVNPKRYMDEGIYVQKE